MLGVKLWIEAFVYLRGCGEGRKRRRSMNRKDNIDTQHDLADRASIYGDDVARDVLLMRGILTLEIKSNVVIKATLV
jgi:hypothetical protein